MNSKCIIKLKTNDDINSNFYIIKYFKCQQYCVKVCYCFGTSGHAFEAISTISNQGDDPP